MNFHFKNSSQAQDLISQLQVGQIIKVQVIEKKGSGQYLIGYKDLQVTAASELDLLSRSCWLKVQQLTPYPKFQLIVGESTGMADKLFQYADENGLILPQMSQPLTEVLATLDKETSPQDLYEFVSWYSENHSWSKLCELYLPHLKKGDIALDDILKLNRLYSIEKKTHPCGIEVNQPIYTSLWDEMENETINRINSLNPDIRLALLHIDSPLYRVTIPVETHSQQIMGIVKTERLGTVAFECKPFKEKENAITLHFENSLYLNAILKTLPINRSISSSQVRFSTPLEGKGWSPTKIASNHFRTNKIRLITPSNDLNPIGNIIIKIIEKDEDLL